MKTMIDITFDFLKKNHTETFQHIWEEVLSVKDVEWTEDASERKAKQIRETKMAELYTLLTVSGEFIRTPDEKFGLVEDFTYQEVQSMKVNIGEIKE